MNVLKRRNRVSDDDNNAEPAVASLFANIFNKVERAVKNTLKLAWQRFTQHPSSNFGRFVQLSEVILVALLASACILVQVYTDAQLYQSRNQKSLNLKQALSISFQLYDLVVLLAKEMEPFYEFNQGPYDLFLQKAQVPMRNVDEKLIWFSNWPTRLCALSPSQQVNLTSSVALRLAIKGMRDMRKAANGTSEKEVINFYSGIITNLAELIRATVLGIERYPGWDDFLTAYYTFEMYINFKKFAILGRKMVAENRTVAEHLDLYESLLNFYWQYVEFEKVVSAVNDKGAAKIKNLTDQESTKNVEKLNYYVTIGDFVSLSPEDWNPMMALQEDNIIWIIENFRTIVDKNLRHYADAWNEDSIASTVLFAVAAAISVFSIFVHIIATWRLQSRIAEAQRILSLLNEALAIVYDYLPWSFVAPVKSGEFMHHRKHTDTCVMVLDIRNVQELISELEPSQLLQVMAFYFEEIERRLVKYNCFKVDVVGDVMALASGIGEFHATDHVAEMVYLALDLNESFAQANLENEVVIRLRIGIHVGPCYARVFTCFKVPQVLIFGPAMQIAAVVHATGLAMKIHVSSAVYNWLYKTVDEIEFIQRGTLHVEKSERALKTYWAQWSEPGISEEVDDQQSLMY